MMMVIPTLFTTPLTASIKSGTAATLATQASDKEVTCTFESSTDKC